MKKCELCKCTARIYCESDQASLCWTCDAKVHSANFLVARHLRSLLCRWCQSPTPWTASGEKLGHTASLCGPCVEVCYMPKNEREEEVEESQGGNDDDFESESEFYSNEDDDDDEDDEEDDCDNQVVPLSSTSPPPAASSSSIEEFSSADINGVVSSNRSGVADLCSEDDVGCSYSPRNNTTITSEAAADRGGEDVFVDSAMPRPLKIRKIEAGGG